MGYSRDSLAPSANLSSSVSGSAIWPRFERWTSVVSPAALTESTAWSSRAVVDERVEPLVHPRVAPLVGPDHHGKPLVPELVGQHPVLVLALREGRHERQHRILHAFDQPFHCRRLRPRVHAPPLAEVLDREPCHPVRFLPRGGARAVDSLNQDPVPTRRVP